MFRSPDIPPAIADAPATGTPFLAPQAAGVHPTLPPPWGSLAPRGTSGERFPGTSSRIAPLHRGTGLQPVSAALPKALFLAFTGTPLIAGEERTKDVFGDYVSIHDF